MPDCDELKPEKVTDSVADYDKCLKTIQVITTAVGDYEVFFKVRAKGGTIID